MIVELFVGTLTRYYSKQWQNARTAEGNPSPFVGEPNPNEVTDPAQLQDVIGKWRDDTSAKLKEHLDQPLAWQEGMLPGWQVGDLGFPGYGGAVMLAAYTTASHLPKPTGFIRTWENDPAFKFVMAGEAKHSLWEIMNCGLWLPANFQFGIGMKDPAGQPTRAGSLELLWNALEYMNDVHWKSPAARIGEWRRHTLAETDSFETQSRFGFSVFYEMARIARENHLPMKLHY